MAAELRRLGYNIEKASQRKYNTIDDFAKAVNLSLRDVHRLFEGRLVLSPFQLKAISEKVDISLKELLDVSGKYNLVECMGSFKDKRNEDKVLDLIDDYIDLMEAIS